MMPSDHASFSKISIYILRHLSKVLPWRCFPICSASYSNVISYDNIITPRNSRYKFQCSQCRENGFTSNIVLLSLLIVRPEYNIPCYLTLLSNFYSCIVLATSFHPSYICLSSIKVQFQGLGVL